MEQMIQNLIQELQKFNKSLGKCALKKEVFQDLEEDFSDLIETKKKINELISSHSKLSSKSNPDEATYYLTEMYREILDFGCFFEDIRLIIIDCMKQHDRLTKPSDPKNTISITKHKELTLQCGIYILDKIGPYLIVRDNDKGISIFDYELNLVKNIPIVGGLFINYVYKHAFKNEILLYDQEHRRFILINLDDFSFKTIPITSIDPNIRFLPLYQWETNKIILINNEDNFFVCNTQSGKIKSISEKTFGIMYPELYSYWYHSYMYGKVYYFINKKEFAVDHKEDELICFFNWNEEPLKEMARPNLDIHDIVIDDNKICFVSEEAIQIMDQNLNTLVFLRPPTNHEFTRARLIKTNDKTLLITLSGHYAPIGSESKLICYELN